MTTLQRIRSGGAWSALRKACPATVSAPSAPTALTCYVNATGVGTATWGPPSSYGNSLPNYGTLVFTPTTAGTTVTIPRVPFGAGNYTQSGLDPTLTYTVTLSVTNCAGLTSPVATSAGFVAAGGVTIPSGFPTAANTGIRGAGIAATALTTFAGMGTVGGVPQSVVNSAGTTINVDNAVIDMALFTQYMTIAANNVTIKRSLFRSGSGVTSPPSLTVASGYTPALIQDCEFDGQGVGAANLTARNCTINRCDIHGASNGVYIGTNMTLQNSYLHDLALNSYQLIHPDSLQTPQNGTTHDSVTITNNTITAYLGNYRVDAAATVTNGSATVTDSAITSADIGFTVIGPGIPTPSSGPVVVNTVNPGVSFTMANPQTTSVLATASGTGVTIGGRYDASATVTMGSATVHDSAINTLTDGGATVTGPGIPANTFVGNPTHSSGTFTLQTTTNVPVTANANGTGVTFPKPGMNSVWHFGSDTQTNFTITGNYIDGGNQCFQWPNSGNSAFTVTGNTFGRHAKYNLQSAAPHLPSYVTWSGNVFDDGTTAAYTS